MSEQRVESFNSTLVQLKADSISWNGTIILSFNSTLVQLKGISNVLPDPYFPCFNSTFQLKACKHPRRI